MSAGKALINGYFEWLLDLVDPNDDYTNYTELLWYLYRKEFRWSIEKDQNRSADGLGLRRRFAIETEQPDIEAVQQYLGGCTVLEMMVALARRCDQDIMYDPDFGDRTAEWFWEMIGSLGLDSQTDPYFDDTYVDSVINRMLDRKYRKNGEGGLFQIQDKNKDLRKAELWYQLCWHLDEELGYT